MNQKNGKERRMIMVLSFERGRDPKSKMGIGISQKLEELVAESIEKHKFNLVNLPDLLSEEEKRITEELGARVFLKIKSPGEAILDYFLIVTCESIGYKKEFSIQGFAWPTMQKVVAKTISGDLVSVKPMAAPKAEIFYTDYQYVGVKKNASIRKRKKGSGSTKRRKGSRRI